MSIYIAVAEVRAHKLDTEAVTQGCLMFARCMLHRYSLPLLKSATPSMVPMSASLKFICNDGIIMDCNKHAVSTLAALA